MEMLFMGLVFLVVTVAGVDIDRKQEERLKKIECLHKINCPKDKK